VVMVKTALSPSFTAAALEVMQQMNCLLSH